MAQCSGKIWVWEKREVLTVAREIRSEKLTEHQYIDYYARSFEIKIIE